MHGEQIFFKDVAQKIISHTSEFVESNSIKTHKVVKGDYATELDISTENLIVAEIRRRFPHDDILAEEGSSDTSISDNRIWVIDPICGTTNLGRNINAYCTNIALLINREIVASCVVDHSNKEYLWSVGEGVYVGEQKLKISRRDHGRVIDVDFGAVMKARDDIKKWYGSLVSDLSMEEAWMLTSMNSSLSFAYVANRKIDGAICVRYNLWDVCASIFLIRQMGGRVTDFKGVEWTVDSDNLVISLDREVHERILQAISRA